MPLPDGGSIPWPPNHCGPINEQIAVWSAWYSGDAEQLANVYAGATARDTTGYFASEQGGFRAGVRRALDTVRRWFWGNRGATVTARQRLHVPIAGDIASASADLLFSEPPTVTVVDEQAVDEAEDAPEDPTQARLNELLDEGTHATLLEAAEICAALGGVYLRIVWDPTVRDRPWITAVHPDVAVPEWKWGKLDAVTFWREIHRKGKLVVRHLERHEAGKILHGVYEGTVDELGRVAPLTDYPDTAGLANEQLVNGNEIHTGAPGLTAVYVPNMKPNRIWRNTPQAAYLGRSDYAGVEPLMDALDMVYSSWMRDVDLGKARLVVPRDYMQSNGPGQGATVDLDREVYEPINTMTAEGGGMEIKEFQFEIRVEQHAATVTDLKSQIVGAAGYSAETFGLDTSGPAVTATEVTAKRRRSLITRDRKTRYWQPQLADLYESWLHVDAKMFRSAVTPQRPNVTWADAVSADPEAVARELQALFTAQAISIEQRVRRQHPDWTDPQVDVEVDRIRKDFGLSVEDPDTFTGRVGGTPPPVPPPDAGGGDPELPEPPYEG